MTKIQLWKHLTRKNGGCPFCRSDNIEGDGVDIRANDKGPMAVQQVTCMSCMRSWVDEYQLVNAFELE